MKVDDLATIWCEWAEMELRHENHDEALVNLNLSNFYP